MGGLHGFDWNKEDLKERKREYAREYYRKNRTKILKKRKIARKCGKKTSSDLVMGESVKKAVKLKTVNMTNLVNGSTFRYPGGEEYYQIVVHWGITGGRKQPKFFFNQISKGILRPIKSCQVVKVLMRYRTNDKF